MTRSTALSLLLAAVFGLAGGGAATAAVADPSSGGVRVASIPPRCC